MNKIGQPAIYPGRAQPRHTSDRPRQRVTAAPGAPGLQAPRNQPRILYTRKAEGPCASRRPEHPHHIHPSIPRAQLSRGYSITDINLALEADSRPEDAELAILESIYSSQKHQIPLTQRDLAVAAGLSLGMTNALLKRFAEKGWVLLRRMNTRTIHYALSPDGVNEIAHRTYRYFKRSARNASMYRDLIEAFVMKARRNGVDRIVLAGSSDLDFILEFACERHGVLFVKGSDASRAARLGEGNTTLILEAEDGVSGVSGAVSIAKVLVGSV